ncbi:MAG: PAS domain-containing protein, partial [Chthonomonadaceae bacterium]|nr:PAS domain-containing protein [Chthonomonadaceae bacterium]
MSETNLPQIRLLESVLSSIADLVYVFDRNCRFVYINQALLDLWQKSLPETIGKNFFDLGYPPALATRLQEQIQVVLKTGQIVRDETEYTSPSGIGYYEYIFTPVFGEGKRVEAVAGTTRDITYRQKEKAEKEFLLKTLEVERTRLSELLKQAPAFIAVLRGPDHVFDMVNDHYRRLVGNKDLIGQKVRDVFPEVEGQGFFEVLDRVYRSGEPFIGQNMRILFEREKGELLEERLLDFVYQPLIEADDSVTGILVHGVDFTERKRVEEALEKNTQALALAVEGAQLGTFYCEFPLDKIIWNDLCKDHFFLPHDAEVDFDLFYSLLHPDDRERTRLAIQKALEKREQYNIEYRAVSPDGRTRWINAIGKGYYDESGEPYRFDGITIDITEKKVRERALALLVEINDATREMQNAEATMETVVTKLGEFLDVSCCAYASVAEDGDHFTVLRDYTKGCLSSAGDYELKAFGLRAVCDLKAGKTLIIRDREKETTPEDNLSAFASLQIKAIIGMPLVKDGKLVAMMAVYQTE